MKIMGYSGWNIHCHLTRKEMEKKKITLELDEEQLGVLNGAFQSGVVEDGEFMIQEDQQRLVNEIADQLDLAASTFGHEDRYGLKDPVSSERYNFH